MPSEPTLYPFSTARTSTSFPRTSTTTTSVPLATTSPSLITSTRAVAKSSLAGRRQLRDGDTPLADQVIEMHHRLLVADLLALLLVRRVQRYSVEHRGVGHQAARDDQRGQRPAPAAAAMKSEPGNWLHSYALLGITNV